MADVGCRNTVFGAEAQEASLHLEAWRAAGIGRFRLEFAHESAEQVKAVTRAFEDALAGRRTGRELMQHLQKVAPQGVHAGEFLHSGELSHATGFAVAPSELRSD